MGNSTETDVAIIDEQIACDGRLVRKIGELENQFESEDAEKGCGKVSIKALRQQLERQQYRCAYSGIELTPQECSLDHKLPLCKGGTHSMDNIQFVTPVVNRMKGTMGHNEFVDLCRMVYMLSHGNLQGTSQP